MWFFESRLSIFEMLFKSRLTTVVLFNIVSVLLRCFYVTQIPMVINTDSSKCTNCNQLLPVRHILTECTSCGYPAPTGGRFHWRLCVCLFFPRDISKTDAARVAKLGVQNVTLETHSFWAQKVKVTSHINSAGVGLCTLLSAGF